MPSGESISCCRVLELNVLITRLPEIHVQRERGEMTRHNPNCLKCLFFDGPIQFHYLKMGPRTDPNAPHPTFQRSSQMSSISNSNQRMPLMISGLPLCDDEIFCANTGTYFNKHTLPFKIKGRKERKLCI